LDENISYKRNTTLQNLEEGIRYERKTVLSSSEEDIMYERNLSPKLVEDKLYGKICFLTAMFARPDSLSHVISAAFAQARLKLGSVSSGLKQTL
jgi:hypothetical protein